MPISIFIAIVRALSSSTVSFSSSLWISSFCMFALKTSLMILASFSPRSQLSESSLDDHRIFQLVHFLLFSGLNEISIECYFVNSDENDVQEIPEILN